MNIHTQIYSAILLLLFSLLLVCWWLIWWDSFWSLLTLWGKYWKRLSLRVFIWSTKASYYPKLTLICREHPRFKIYKREYIFISKVHWIISKVLRFCCVVKAIRGALVSLNPSTSFRVYFLFVGWFDEIKFEACLLFEEMIYC